MHQCGLRVVRHRRDDAEYAARHTHIPTGLGAAMPAALGGSAMRGKRRGHAAASVLLRFTLALVLASTATAYRSGAPLCTVNEQMMMNGMGFPPWLTDTSVAKNGGFALSLSASTFVPGGDALTVTLVSPDDRYATGFLLVAEAEGEAEAGIGTLSGPDEDCVEQPCAQPAPYSASGSTPPCHTSVLTHMGKGTKPDTLTFTWTPPSDFGNANMVRFSAIVVSGSMTQWYVADAVEIFELPPPCPQYCQDMATHCSMVSFPNDDCMGTCATYTRGAATGATLECRAQHAGFASTGAVHCDHAKPVPEGPCAEMPPPPPPPPTPPPPPPAAVDPIPFPDVGPLTHRELVWPGESEGVVKTVRVGNPQVTCCANAYGGGHAPRFEVSLSIYPELLYASQHGFFPPRGEQGITIRGSNGNELDVFGVQRIFGAGIQNDGLLVWAADTYEQWVAANQRPSIEDFKAAFPSTSRTAWS